MKKIGGNKTVEIQVKTTATNDIGEQIDFWETVQTLTGFLDLVGGDSRYTVYNAKIQESTHLFICQYILLDNRIKADTARLWSPDEQVYYNITLIDNPMGLNYQWEFYLKFVGGQNG